MFYDGNEHKQPAEACVPGGVVFLKACVPGGLCSWKPVFLEALILVLYSCFPGGFCSWKPWYRQYYWHCIPVFLIIPPLQRAEPEYSCKDNKIKISNPIVIKYYCNNVWTEVWLWHWLVSLSSNNWTSSLPPPALSLRTWNIQVEDNCEPLIGFAEISQDFLITHFYSQPLRRIPIVLCLVWGFEGGPQNIF